MMTSNVAAACRNNEFITIFGDNDSKYFGDLKDIALGQANTPLSQRTSQQWRGSLTMMTEVPELQSKLEKLDEERHRVQEELQRLQSRQTFFFFAVVRCVALSCCCARGGTFNPPGPKGCPRGCIGQ